jgi:hypothetical protein
MTAQTFFYVVLTAAVMAGSSFAQETRVAKEGLSGGIPIPPDTDLVEGKWSAFHIWTKNNTWKNSGIVQVQKDEKTGRLSAIWTDNGGGDDPEWNDAINPKNQVKIGTTVTLDRKLGSGRVDGDGENAQTWRGTLYKEESGNIKIEGHVSGAWIKWEKTNGNADTFLLVKQVVKPSR